MERMFSEQPLNQNNNHNTVDGGIRLQNGRDVRSRSDAKKLKSYQKGSGSHRKIGQPVVDGEEVTKRSPTSSHGSLSICGRRREMEDTIKICPRLMLSQQQQQQQEQEQMVLDFFAVYDGHGGACVADVCREKLHSLLVKEINESLNEGNEIDWNKVLGNTFVKMDHEVEEFDLQVDEDIKSIGSTAIVAVVSMNQIVVANCGDSRAVLCRRGQVVPLSSDHKPDRPDELARIEEAGGYLIYWNGCRVLGVLATSRSIGDQHLKPYVTSVPEVSITERNEDDEFIILASDGLWDVITNEMACQIVRKVLSGRLRRKVPNFLRGTYANEAANVLSELAVVRGSKDNISVVVIELNKVR